MAEILKTDLKAFDTCVLYESLQNKSPVDAHKSVLKVLSGPFAVMAFEFMNQQMTNRNFSIIRNPTVRKSVDSILKDKKAVYNCMLYEFAQNKPLGQTYKSICTVFGKDFINFKELKNLFDKFKNGNFEIGIDEKNENEMDGGWLTEMPVEIVEKIVENLDLMDRLIVRKVCKTFRSVVDNSKIFCEKIQIAFSDRTTTLWIENHPPIEYNHIGSHLCKVEFNGEGRVVKEFYTPTELADLNTFMKNPKFELGTLTTHFLLGIPFAYHCCPIRMMESPEIRLGYIERFFDSLKNPLHVNSFSVNFEIHDDELEPVMSILPYLKPGVLKKIRIKMDFDQKEMMQKVVKLDQWKQAIELDMGKSHFNLPFKHLLKFKKFEVFCPKLTEEEVVQIKEAIFKIPTFESCVLRYYDDELDTSFIRDRLGASIGDSDDEDYYNNYCLYKSPFTESIYSIVLTDCRVYIEKK